MIPGVPVFILSWVLREKSPQPRTIHVVSSPHNPYLHVCQVAELICTGTGVSPRISTYKPNLELLYTRWRWRRSHLLNSISHACVFSRFWRREPFISGSRPVWRNVYCCCTWKERNQSREREKSGGVEQDGWEKPTRQIQKKAPRQNRPNSLMIGRLPLQLQLSANVLEAKTKKRNERQSTKWNEPENVTEIFFLTRQN